MDPFTVDFGDIISGLEIRQRSGCVWNRFRDLNKPSMIAVDIDTQSSEFGIVKIFDGTLVVAPFDVIGVWIVKGSEGAFDGAAEHVVGVFDRFVVISFSDTDSGCEGIP